MKAEITRHTPLADLPEMLRVDEASTWLDVGRSTLFEMIKAGSLPHARFGRLVRIPRSALEQLAGGGDSPLESRG